MMDDRNDQSTLLNLLAGIGLGAIVGAAVALVLAPKPGAEIRDDIRGTLDDLKAKAEKVAGDLATKGEEIVTRGRSVVDSTKSRITEAVSAGREAMDQANTEVKDNLEELG